MGILDRVEHFPALQRLAGVRHAFIKRMAGIDVSHDKAEALRRLDAAHRAIRESLGMGGWPLVTAQQVHGNEVAAVDSPVTADVQFTGRDGLMTDQRGVLLGIYAADCCAVYLVDPVTPAIALLHSGKKGTESNIVGKAIDQMSDRFRTDPANLVVQLSPCIRPPHYEIDFAAEIRRQCRERGLVQIHDSGECTACDVQAYYSYRMEKGKTGRMVALLALA